MAGPWRSRQPLWQQLRCALVERIIEGRPRDGEALPSVRALAAEFGLNPLTVHRALRALADEGLVLHRRGRPMVLAEGAAARLVAAERRRFLDDDWPRIAATLRRLGLSAADL